MEISKELAYDALVLGGRFEVVREVSDPICIHPEGER